MKIVLKKLLAIGGIMVASSIVGLALVEAGARMLGISYPLYLQLDPIRGTSLYPGAEGWQTREGNAYIKINSHGLRDREYGRDKPPGAFRVAVLGDSFAEALQVAHSATFWSVLEKKLGRCPAMGERPVEVINFGISGHGTGQELLTLRHHVWQFDPDLVLLAFYTGNDIRNNSRALERSPHRPYFVYRGEQLVLDDSFSRLPEFSADRLRWNKIRIKWIDRFRTLQILREAMNRIREMRQIGHATSTGKAGIHDSVFHVPRTENWRRAWRVTEGLLSSMNHEVNKRGKAFWIVTLTNGKQVHPDRKLRNRYMRKLGVANLDYPDRRIAAFAARNGIPAISLLAPFRKHADTRGEILHGFDRRGVGHWNRAGHRLAGTIISQKLCTAAGRSVSSVRKERGR